MSLCMKILLLCLLPVACVFGQEQQAETGNSAARLQQLEQKVQELQQQINALKSQMGATAQPATVPAEAPVAESQSFTVTAPPPDISRLHFRGFGELNYEVLDQRNPEIANGGFVAGSAGNFFLGDFDLLVTAGLSPRAGVIGEVDFEETDAQHFDVDVRRLLLNYNFNDWLRASFGRYQIAIGYYNSVFPSGAWLQTMADRPLIVSFPGQGGVVPVEAIGASFKGAIPSGKVGLNYLFEYGSSDTIRNRFGGSVVPEDENNSNAINVGLFLHPDGVPGLEIGGSFYHDNISDDRNLSIRYGQSIVNGHVVYVAHGWEFLNEAMLIRHAELNSSTVFNMPGGYTQISKQLGHVRPFFRFQHLNANPRSILHDVQLRYGPSFGARYDFNSNIAFKLQFDNTERKAEPDLNGVQTELSFNF